MLWPIVLPFISTCVFLLVIIVLATAFAPVLKWKRIRVFCAVFCAAGLAFIPSCTAIMTVIDSQRFGVFQYDTSADVEDVRVEQYLPSHATNITVEKCADGHCARYSISQTELTGYLDNLWDHYGRFSAASRSSLEDGVSVAATSFDSEALTQHGITAIC